MKKGMGYMTENKRYSLDFEECDAIWIDDNVENKSYTIRNDTIKEKELEEIVDELNNLADENEHLIRKRGELETRNAILKGENEELKQRIIELEEEDEQLKQQLNMDKTSITSFALYQVAKRFFGKDGFEILNKSHDGIGEYNIIIKKPKSDVLMSIFLDDLKRTFNFRDGTKLVISCEIELFKGLF